jgi:hypothetical protein
VKTLSLRLSPLIAIAAMTLAPVQGAWAVSPWAGHWETVDPLGDGRRATLDIRDLGRLFLIHLEDDIPAIAWNNPDCHGPADARGTGLLVDSTHMAILLAWHCDAGGAHQSLRYLKLNDHGDANPANDEVAFCTSLSITSCSVVFHHPP